MKIRILPLFAVALFLCLNQTFAQEQSKVLQLLDNETTIPVSGAVYQLAGKKAVTDAEGLIKIETTANDTLFISHISYGEWFLTPAQLQDALSAGVIYKAEQIINAQPVTIVALRHASGKNREISLSLNDKLTHDAGSILSKIPAISSIRKSGGYGFDPVLRGFKYDQLNVVINGTQSAIAACPNRMDPPTSQISPNMMESVEILKGPHSLRYGTSFGGTINFKSRPSRFPASQKIYGRLSSSSESNGGILRSEGVAGLSNEYLDLSLLGSWSKGNDYSSGDGQDIAAEFQRISYGANIGVKINADHQLALSLSRNEADKTDFPALPMDLIKDKTNLINLQHNMIVNGQNLKSWNSAAYFTGVDHKMSNLEKDLNPRMVNAETIAETYSFGGRTEGKWLLAHGKLFAGADVRVDQADGDRKREFLMGPMQGKTVYDNVWNGGRITRSALFAEYHHAFLKMNMIVSTRIEHNAAEATDLNPAFAEKNSKTKVTEINPSFSVGLMREFSNGLNIGAWVGRAQRSAGLSERYINSFPIGLDPYDMLGNPDLKAEVNNQIDVHIGFKTKSSAIDLNLFGSYLTDYISSEIDTLLSPTMPSSPGVRRFNNLDEAILSGFELTWQYRFAMLTQDISLSYTFGRDNSRKEPLPEIAPLDIRYNLYAHYLENRLQPNLSYRYVLKQDRISETFGETKTAAFGLLDVGLSYRITQDIETRMVLKNALDEKYYEHLSRAVRGTSQPIYAPGRSLFISAAIDLM